MDKDYFLNHEILGDDPLLLLAFFGFTNIKNITKETNSKEQRANKKDNRNKLSKRTDKKTIKLQH